MFRRIRIQVMALIVAVVLLAALLIGGLAVLRMRVTMTREAVKNQAASSQAIRQALATKFEEIEAQLRFLTGDPVMLRDDPVAVNDRVAAFLVQNPLFFCGFVSDPHGNVQVATFRNQSKRAEKLRGTNIYQDDTQFPHLGEAIRRVVETNRPVVAETLSSVRQGPLLIMNVPVTGIDDSSRVYKVLSVGLHINGVVLHRMLQPYGTTGGFILLVDRAGNIIARNGALAPELVGVDLRRPPKGDQAEAAWKELGGRSYLVLADPFPSLNGFLLIGQPRTEVLGIVNALSREMLAAAGLALLLATGLAIMLADRFMIQLLQLIEGIRKVADGVYSWRMPAPSDDELGDAGRAFNSMVEHLERNRMIEELWRQQWTPPR